MFWDKIIVCFLKVSLTKGLFSLKFFKIMYKKAHDQEMVLSQGYVLDQIIFSRIGDLC